MILSCLPVSYFGPIILGEMSIRQWANEAAILGLDAIDLSILFCKNGDRYQVKKIREDVESAGMRVALINTYPDLTHPNAREREQQLSNLAVDIATASQIGATAVRVTSGQAYPETSREDGIKWVMDGLMHAAQAAERCGIQLVYENHSKPGIWDYPDFNLATDVFLEIASSLRGTPIGLLFDTANPLVYGDDSMDVLEPIIDQVVWVHAADTGIRGVLRPVIVGTGIVPFDRIFARLHKAGFNGGISVEEASGQSQAGVKEAVTFVRKAWRVT